MKQLLLTRDCQCHDQEKKRERADSGMAVLIHCCYILIGPIGVVADGEHLESGIVIKRIRYDRMMEQCFKLIKCSLTQSFAESEFHD